MSGGRWIEANRDGRCTHCKNPFVSGAEIFIKSSGVYLCFDCGTLAENVEDSAGRIETSVLTELAKLPIEAGAGLLAQNMLHMAKQLDDGDIPPREVTQYTKELRLNLLSLQDAYPVGEEDDETEAARQKRERRARESGGY